MRFTPATGLTWQDRATLALSLMFVYIANVPGTIAFRYLLLLCAIALSLPNWRELGSLWRAYRWPLGALAGFAVYGALHSSLMTAWPRWAWGEFSSQFLIGCLWFLVGLLLFIRLRGTSILDVTILAGAALALTEFGICAWVWLRTGHWPFMQTFVTVTHLEFTFFMNLVLAYVLTVLCFDFGQRPKLSRLPRWGLALITALLVYVSVRAGARNGMIGLVYLSLSLLLIYQVFEGKAHGRARMLLLTLAVLAVVSSLAVYSFKKDPRNAVLIESVDAGWNYQRTQAWLGKEPLPIAHDHVRVDESAYCRVAWIHSGLDIILQHPMGFGYGRGAFGRALLSLGFGSSAGSHSHSGIIDLGVGLGVPGIALWLIFCWSLIAIGLSAFARRGELLGLVLAFISAGFIGRMLIESIMRDHMLYLFLFSVGTLLAEMEARRRAGVTGPAKH